MKLIKKWNKYNILNSCPTQGQWIARVPIDHACRTITGVDERKWMRLIWKNVGLNFVVGKTWETPRKTYADTYCPPRNPHGVTATRIGTPAVWSGHLDACATRTPTLIINHSVLPKDWSFTANSAFSTLPSSQPSFSYLHTVHLS